MTEKLKDRRIELQQMAIDAKVRHQKALDDMGNRYTYEVNELAMKLRQDKAEENQRYMLEVAEIQKEQQEINSKN